jgi:predicted dehydrogenase
VTGRDNLQGIFEVSWRKSGYRMPEFGLSIHGTKGALKVNDDEVELEFLGEAPKRYYRHDLDDNTIGFFLGGPEYYREDKHFIDSIFTGETCRSSFENTLQVDYLLEQARRQSGK